MIPKHYLKKDLIKMGRWPLLPADTENWMSEGTSQYFKKAIGFPRAILIICTLDDGMEHAYVSKDYFRKLYSHIQSIIDKNYKAVEKKINVFYELRKIARVEIPKITAKDFGKISNKSLAELYMRNRDWVHRVTVYDQFGWLAEEYWSRPMEEVLVKKLKLEKNSKDYHRILFALTKPEEISTTLTEKRAVLKEAVAIKKKQQTIEKASRKLTKSFGWIPVFAYGEPWDDEYYKKQLNDLLKEKLIKLETELLELNNYSARRNEEISQIQKQYNISEKDLQIFIDFGLALDGRNEAEYLVSYAGFWLLPIYKEIKKRLALSIKQLRTLYEKEIIEALMGKIDPLETLYKKKDIVAYGFDKKFEKRINFDTKDARKLFDHIESYVKNVQGNIDGQGVCASPGKVIGKAVIIHAPTENSKVKKGDILITHATTVDYLPSMKRAAAFVTEVGGLTCHAAVVAREFGVPCVVGLKNATKNFKDGDMVEVDANKGIVRKI